MRRMNRLLLICGALAVVGVSVGGSEDWSQWGGTSSRNNVSDTTKIPDTWDYGKIDRKTGAWIRDEARNIKWIAKVGSQTYATPVIADGRIFIGSNNGAAYLARYPSSIDLGCLLCFREADGKFLWQYSSEKLSTGRVHDWPQQGIVSAPLVEGNRLWFVNNRNEVVCADTEGFYDDEDDVPGFGLRDPQVPEDKHEADVVWTYDIMRELGVHQHNLATCCITAWGNTLFVCTGNGVDSTHVDLPAPEAPSFIALDKKTGQLLWSDDSPGANILHGQWSAPAVAELGGVPQVVFPGGDGWLYSFRADRWQDGKPELLWKFDTNPKVAKWSLGGRGTRNSLAAIPVINDGLVYIPSGQDPEHGEGEGHLWCIDPTKRGDVSSELVIDPQGKPLPHFRYDATDAWIRIFDVADDAGEGLETGTVSQTLRGHFECAGFQLPDKVHVQRQGQQWLLNATIRDEVRKFRLQTTSGKPDQPAPRVLTVELKVAARVVSNPNSAAVWHYTGGDADGDGELEFEEEFHRSLSSVAIKDDLLFICDLSGLVHCLHAKTGQVHWTCDLLAAGWGTPLIVDGKVYVGDEDGDVAIFKLSADPAASVKPAMYRSNGTLYSYNQAKHEMLLDNSIYSSPVAANGVLYISDRMRLYAIAYPVEE